MRTWTTAIAAAVLAGGVWLAAARNGYGLELIWLPAVVIGAAWPYRSRRLRDCFPRRRAVE